MTQIESKPRSSAWRTIRASVGPMASGPPGQSKAVIWRPIFIASKGSDRAAPAEGQALSSRWSGVGKRGMIRTPSIQAVSAAARASMAAAASGPDILEQAGHDLAVRALAPAADDAAIEPDRRAGVAVAVEQGRAVRPEIPVARGPAHRRRVEGRQERDPRVRARPSPVSRSSAITRPVVPSLEVDLDRVERGEGPADGPERPAGPPAQVVGRAGTVGAQPALHQLGLGRGLRDSRRPGPPSSTQRCIGSQRYWLLTHVPRGRPRLIRPSIASRNRTRVETPTVPW